MLMLHPVVVFLNIRRRQTIIFIVTHLLAFYIGFAFKLHPPAWRFSLVKSHLEACQEAFKRICCYLK